MKYKLTPEQVEVYEEFSGIKTTGNVEIELIDRPIWDILDKLYD